MSDLHVVGDVLRCARQFLRPTTDEVGGVLLGQRHDRFVALRRSYRVPNTHPDPAHFFRFDTKHVPRKIKPDIVGMIHVHTKVNHPEPSQEDLDLAWTWVGAMIYLPNPTLYIYHAGAVIKRYALDPKGRGLQLIKPPPF